MPTTQRAIYDELLQAIRTGVSSKVSSQHVHIALQPTFYAIGSQYIQIIPQVPQAVHRRSGVGLITEQFQVATWVRVHLDIGGVSTEKLINESLGVMELLALIRSSLIQNQLRGEAVVPVTWVQGSVPQEPPNQDTQSGSGWLMYTDTFEVGYEIDWRGES